MAAAGGVAVSALTLVLVPASPPYAKRRAKAARVRDRCDLFVTMVGRAWIVMGMTMLNTYVLYFFHDVLGVRNASANTGLVAGAAMVGAVVSSVWAGAISDKVDRRLVVCLLRLADDAAALGFALAPELRFVFVYALLFGLGYGGVFSVGWALALDSIPELGDVARDLGIWGTLSNLADGRRAGDRRGDHRQRSDASRRLSLAVRRRRRVFSSLDRSPCSQSHKTGAPGR